MVALGDNINIYCFIFRTITNHDRPKPIKTFALVAQNLSFTKAAKILGQPKSRVSRAVARLESELGEQLLLRSTRKTQLTEQGKLLFKGVQANLEGLQAEVERFTGESDPLAGSVRLSLPEDMSHLYLSDLATRFLKLYPKIRLVLLPSNQILDPIDEGLDLAIRVGPLADSSMKAVRLGDVQGILVASPTYLKKMGTPNEMIDLKKHQFLGFASQGQAGLLSSITTEDPQFSGVQHQVLATNFLLLKELALKHQGVALLPDFFCRKEMEAQKLIRVLPQWKNMSRQINLVYLASKNQPKRVRVLIDFLKAELRPLLSAKQI